MLCVAGAPGGLNHKRSSLGEQKFVEGFEGEVLMIVADCRGFLRIVGSMQYMRSPTDVGVLWFTGTFCMNQRLHHFRRNC